jgi:hypothetical protein
MSWDHDDDPTHSTPKQFSSSRRRTAKDTVGYVDDMRLTGDGDQLEIEISVPRKDDASKVDANLAYVSPVVFDKWRDGKGNQYGQCITHVDLVQHPVDNSQSEFQPIACGIRMGLETGKPVFYRLANGDDEIEKDDDFEDEEGDDDNRSSGADLSQVLQQLRLRNIVLSEDTDESNFLDHLTQALLTANAMETDDMAGDQNGGLQVESPDIATLSLDAIRQTDAFKKAKPEQQQAIIKRFSVQPEKTDPNDSPLFKHATNQHRETVATRLSALLDSGRCTPDEFKTKKESVTAVRLSLDANGQNQPGELEMWISSREDIPAGTFWDDTQRTRLSKLTVEPHPDVTGGEDQETAETNADFVLGVKR